MVHDGRRIDLDSTVLVVGPRDELRADAGVVEVDLDPAGPPSGAAALATLRAQIATGEVVVARLPEVAGVVDDDDARGRAIALATLAVADGCRVLRTNDARLARRAAAVVEAITG